MEIVFFWFLCCLFAGIIANSKGRSFWGWFFLGFLVGPFALLVGFMPAISPQAAKGETQSPEVAAPNSAEYRRCPFCAETIRREAIKCRYCNSAITAGQ